MDLLTDEHRPGRGRRHGDPARPGLQQTGHQSGQSGLARPRLPDEHRRVTGRNLQIHLVQDVWTVLITEAHLLHPHRRRPSRVLLRGIRLYRATIAFAGLSRPQQGWVVSVVIAVGFFSGLLRCCRPAVVRRLGLTMPSTPGPSMSMRRGYGLFRGHRFLRT